MTTNLAIEYDSRVNPSRNVVIRVAAPDDGSGVLDIYRPFVETKAVSFEEIAPSVEEIENRIRKILARYPWLIAEDQGRVAGFAYASAHRDRASYRWSVDVSVYLAPEYRGQGLGRELYRMVLEILRRQGFYSVYAGITLPNEGSVGLHEAVGFRPVGIYRNVGFKFGRWHDVGWWQMALKDHVGEIREPIAFREFRESAEFVTILSS
jgi:L-amino acid N-acyltransferase YncA